VAKNRTIKHSFLNKVLVEKEKSYVSNREGWRLEVKRSSISEKLNKKRRPLLILPGYGMNSFIFGYHPTGLAMEDFFAHEGFEVWSANLRGQGGSKKIQGDSHITLKDFGVTDLSVVLHYILQHTHTKAQKVDVIGCSLGGTIAYVYLALVKKNLLGSVVAMGAPLRWEKKPLILEIMSKSPTLLRYLPFRNVRRIAKMLAPLIVRFPSIIHLYLHPEFISQEHIDVMLEVVDDPNRFLNEEIAQWVNNKDLMIDGKNIIQELRRVTNPFLCLIGNSDGIVPSDTALSAYEVMGSEMKDILVVGDDHVKFAHADMFVSDYAQEMVFLPIAQWLKRQYSGRTSK